MQGQRMSYDDPPALAPCVNIAHEINEDSPLHGKSLADMAAEEGAIFVSVAATDDISLQVVSESRTCRMIL